MNIKYLETMQIQVRIASGQHRNISLTMFGIKNIMNIVVFVVVDSLLSFVVIAVVVAVVVVSRHLCKFLYCSVSRV